LSQGPGQLHFHQIDDDNKSPGASGLFSQFSPKHNFSTLLDTAITNTDKTNDPEPIPPRDDRFAIPTCEPTVF
jgi:hypothetical protein